MEPVVDEWMYGVLRELGFSVETADVWDRWVVLGFIVAIAFVSEFVCRQLLVRVVKRFVARTKATWEDILFVDRVLRRLCHIVPPVLIYFLLPLAAALVAVVPQPLRACTGITLRAADGTGVVARTNEGGRRVLWNQ